MDERRNPGPNRIERRKAKDDVNKKIGNLPNW